MKWTIPWRKINHTIHMMVHGIYTMLNKDLAILSPIPFGSPINQSITTMILACSKVLLGEGKQVPNKFRGPAWTVATMAGFQRIHHWFIDLRLSEGSKKVVQVMCSVVRNLLIAELIGFISSTTLQEGGKNNFDAIGFWYTYTSVYESIWFIQIINLHRFNLIINLHRFKFTHVPSPSGSVFKVVQSSKIVFLDLIRLVSCQLHWYMKAPDNFVDILKTYENIQH